MHAVEIGDAGEEAVDAVAVRVAPDRALLLGRRRVGLGVTRRDEPGGRERGAGAAVEDGEELGPLRG